MRYLALLFVFLCTSLAVWAQPQVLVGTFQGLEQGDYYHLLVEDESGQQHSFYLSDDESCQMLVEEDSEAMIGQMVEVRWHTIMKDIPEAGGPIKVNEALSLRFL